MTKHNIENTMKTENNIKPAKRLTNLQIRRQREKNRRDARVRKIKKYQPLCISRGFIAYAYQMQWDAETTDAAAWIIHCWFIKRKKFNDDGWVPISYKVFKECSVLPPVDVVYEAVGVQTHDMLCQRVARNLQACRFVLKNENDLDKSSTDDLTFRSLFFPSNEEIEAFEAMLQVDFYTLLMETIGLKVTKERRDAFKGSFSCSSIDGHLVAIMGGES